MLNAARVADMVPNEAHNAPPAVATIHSATVRRIAMFGPSFVVESSEVSFQRIHVPYRRAHAET